MKIADVRVTPMRLPLKKPYVWSQGLEDAFTVNLIEIESDDGTIGIGETTTAPDALAQKRIIDRLSRHFIGEPLFDYPRLVARAYKGDFLAFGANMPRLANQIFSGLEMAVLDLQGKLLERPVWDLLGGAVRADVGYFYFLQGDTPQELAEDARSAVADDHPIIYLKVGVGEHHDIEATRLVREAIGDARLRLDANEAWDPALALRMMARLAPYDIEYIEQPTSSRSQHALRHLKERSPIALGADQSVFTVGDVYSACRDGVADMIAVGPREIGGLRAMSVAAGITDAAGLRLCIHSSMTTGITTCAEHHVARTIANLDDGNQIMWQLLEEDIVSTPALSPGAGRLALPAAPGLGVTLDRDRVAKANRRFEDWLATSVPPSAISSTATA
ncbi:MAG: mandelate racemase/muconate lactonizing enzyme family protein [Pseudomonadota bacterium]